jgi:hypothetical protein
VAVNRPENGRETKREEKKFYHQERKGHKRDFLPRRRERIKEGVREDFGRK